MQVHHEKLLLIDDDSSLRRAVSRHLEKVGFEVFESDNGNDGVQMARVHSPDLIISDINMDHGDGYSVLSRLRHDPLLASIPLILMTGHADELGMRRSMEQGADDYLAKPFHFETLLGTIEARLARRRAEGATQELLLKTLAATTDLVCVVNLGSHRILHLNQSGRRLMGIEPLERLDGHSLEELYPPAQWTLMRDAAIPAATSKGVWSGDIHFKNRAGGEVPASQVLIVHADVAGKPEHMSVVGRDLSERFEAEQKVAHSYEQLRELAGRLVTAQETERRRIAREIHDELGQQLTGLNTDLAWLEKRLAESKGGRRTTWVNKIAGMQAQIKTTIQTVRRISTDLRPALLDNLGLIAALEWQAREFQKRTGIRCDFQCALETLDWDSDRSTTVFRIFQETLTNVTRHADADSVSASLTRAGDIIRLTVRDNGKGIIEGRARSKSLGILGMTERASLVGGSLHISSEPGAGTTVEAVIPFADNRVNL
ncbi:MAG: response regulator [Verrucomicrobiota bacterium]